MTMFFAGDVYIPLLLCCILWSKSDGTSIRFEPQFYMFQLSYHEAQNVMTIFNATFNPSNAKEQIFQVRLLFEEDNFEFIMGNFSVRNKRPLASGRYEFTLAAYSPSDTPLAVVVVNVISQANAVCLEQAFGRCHHYCRKSSREVNGYECFCEKGYVLQGKFDCVAARGRSEIIANCGTNIVLLDLLGLNVSSLVRQNATRTSFDYDYRSQVLYVAASSITNSTVIEYSMNSGLERVLIELEGVDINSIALDWQNKHLYFIDESSSSLMQLSTIYLNVTSVITLSSNSGNLIYSHLRYLIWISGLPNNTSVEYFSLDSNLIETLALEHIEDIAVSSWNDELFIVSQSQLLSLNFKSQSTPHTIITNLTGTAIALDVFEVYSYTLFEDGSLYKVNNLRPLEDNSVVQIVPGASDFVIYHELKQIGIVEDTLCTQCEGECSVLNGTSMCVCGQSFVLGSDGYSCHLSEVSTFFVSLFFIGGIILERDLDSFSRDVLKGHSLDFQLAGIIHGMDINIEDEVLYYGDRTRRSIWQVSSNAQHMKYDNRQQVMVKNTSVSHMAYDWIRRHLYWIDNESRSIYRVNVNNFTSKILVYQSDEELVGAVIHPLKRYLYFSEAGKGIKRILVNVSNGEVDTIVNTCCSESLAIDIFNNKIYWFELNDGTYNLYEQSLQSNNSKTIQFFSDDLVPFRMAVIQNYIIVTFENISEIAVINRRTFALTFKAVIGPYFAVTVANMFQQPSESEYNCLINKQGCSYLCVPDSSSLFGCTCPLGYFLNMDNSTCSSCPPDTCINGVCSRLDFSCVCVKGYSGTLCDQPICNISCGENGDCVRPNVCQCHPTFSGTDCRRRVCTSDHCSNAGICSLRDGGFSLDCRCEEGRTGDQCEQFDDFPDIQSVSLQGLNIKISMAVVVPTIVVVAAGAILVIGYIKIKFKLHRLIKGKKARSTEDTSLSL